MNTYCESRHPSGIQKSVIVLCGDSHILAYIIKFISIYIYFYAKSRFLRKFCIENVQKMIIVGRNTAVTATVRDEARVIGFSYPYLFHQCPPGDK